MNIRPGQLSRRNLRIAFWHLHQKKCPSVIPQMLINIDDMDDGLVTTSIATIHQTLPRHP